jgi:hypothetical protein
MAGLQVTGKDMEKSCYGIISIKYSSFHDRIKNLVMIAGIPFEIRSYNHLARSVYQHARFSQQALVTSLEAFLYVA